MVDKVAIVTDSVACIPREMLEQYSIEVVPVQVIFGSKAYQDGVDISPAEFYAMLRKAEKLPTTAAALPGSILEHFRKASQGASAIICITLSSKLSGMYNAAYQAIEIAREQLPGITIDLLDSRTAAAAQGLVVLAAARAAASGKSLVDVIETARSVMQRVHLFLMMDTLYYLAKGGRIPKAFAMAGSFLKLKPILTVNDGEAHPVTNPRTVSGAMKRILRLMEQRVIEGLPLHVAVMHADASNEAVELKDRISSKFDCTELFFTEFTPVMGAHTGPGAVGVAFYVEERGSLQ